ncbi:MAG: hypothetical protein M1826_003054 [Phylliscum demangeonii]|nr:MAG: hypothetical protein M1826_003054 [Phylliscum demangeonii]
MPRRGTQQKSLLEGGARSNIGLLVAEHVTAAECVPAFRTSMVDGYALRVPVQPPSPKGVFPVSSLSFAASSQVRDLPPGELVRMATGAPLPYGANAIVMVEDTRLASKTEDGKEETEVEILTDEVRPGENVREIGSDVITALLQDMGYECFDLGTARDQPADLNDQLERGMQRCDVLLTTGGVSMGDRDLLKPAIERHLKGVIHFGRLNAKPGKPTTFATVRQHGRTKAIFSLPGNPAAALAMCYVLVVPGLEIASGVAPAVAGLPKLLVLLDEDIVPDPHRPEYHRVRATVRAGRIHARSTGGQRSSRIGSFLGANALLCLEAREAVYRKGDEVEALIIGSLVGEPRNPAASGS